jgi:hypothetical protein
MAKSSEYEYGTFEYYEARTSELEAALNTSKVESNYYQKELASAHEILGRVTHQLSERWDSVRLTKYYPTDNLSGNRSISNPSGEKK